MHSYPYLIIGAGIIGSSIARELALRGNGPVAVLEKEAEIGLHASGRNSGVLHSGINQKPGSLKARLAVEGNRRARQFCLEHGVRCQECGTVVVGRDERESAVLDRLLEMGRLAGVEDLRLVGREELREIEPVVTGERALVSPHGAIVDSAGFTRAVAEDARKLGVDFVLNAEVTGIRAEVVESTAGEFRTGHLVNCAGLHSDRIAHRLGAGKGCRIIPFRGEYMEIAGLPVNSMIYQAPDLRYPFLGVHLTRTVDGTVLAGPTAMLSFGREAYNKEIFFGDTLAMFCSLNFWRLAVSREFLRLAWHNGRISFSGRAFLAEIRSLAPSVQMQDVRPCRSGIRAQTVDRRGRMVDDMLVEFLSGSTHVLNAVSPGLTAALTFAEYVVDRILELRR